MRCLVTGATGFVGSHLCDHLLRNGDEVLALARPNASVKALEKGGATILRGTLESMNVFARHAAEVDVVFHLAGVTKAFNREGFFGVNAGGTSSLVRGLTRGEFKGRVVYLSSLAAGGPAPDLATLRHEGMIDQPVSQYGKSKRAGEGIVKTGLPDSASWVVLRPGAIYGPREHEILEVLKVLARTGIAVRFGAGVHVQMTHVDDVIQSLMKAAKIPEAAGKTYYIADQTAWSFEDIIRMAGESLRKKVRIIPLPIGFATPLAIAFDLAGKVAGKSLSPLCRDKVHELRAGIWLASSQLAENELEWKTTWNFSDGLADTIKWYRKHKWL